MRSAAGAVKNAPGAQQRVPEFIVFLLVAAVWKAQTGPQVATLF